MGWLGSIGKGLLGGGIGFLAGGPVGAAIGAGLMGGQGFADDAYEGNLEKYQAGMPALKPVEWGSMANEYGAATGANSAYGNSMNAYRNLALGKGLTEQGAMTANLANQKFNQSRQALAGEAAGQAATARGQLAARGALSSGAAERIARSKMQNQIMGNQRLAGQNMQDQTRIAAEDAAARQSALMQLPGQELAPINTWAELRQRDLDRKAKSEADYNMALAQQYANARPERGSVLGSILG